MAESLKQWRGNGGLDQLFFYKLIYYNNPATTVQCTVYTYTVQYHKKLFVYTKYGPLPITCSQVLYCTVPNTCGYLLYLNH